MRSSLTVIYWRDIPAQVIAKRGREAHRKALPPRFQAAIDSAAMRADLAGTDDYLQEWRRDSRECGDDLEAEAAAEAERLKAEHPPSALTEYVRAGGFQARVPSRPTR